MAQRVPRPFRPARRRWLAGVALGAALVALLVPAELWGRIGGGQTYGGGGGGFGGAGGGGDGLGFLFYALINLAFHYPVVGVPLLILAAYLVFRYRSELGSDFSSDRHRARHRQPMRASRDAEAQLREQDSNFSRPLFLDFVRLLYVRVRTAIGSGDLAPLAPYLAQTMQHKIAAKGMGAGDAVSDVIVGSMVIRRTRVTPTRVHVNLLIEANYTLEQGGDAGPTKLWVRELWTLGRQRGVLSKGPGEITALGCPSCGGTVELTTEGRCRHCNEGVTRGDFHWQLETTQLLDLQPVRAIDLQPEGRGRERGLSRPTVYADDFAAARKGFRMRYPDFDWPTFEARVRAAFLALNKAWSTRRWQDARPWETDTLFDRHRYWMDRYRDQGLSNITEDVTITRIEACKMEQDAFYDAITVRIHASMLDYTVEDETGKVVGGSREQTRHFSEYWTLIRRAGFDGKPQDGENCPSCAAPLKLSMAGSCEYCQAHVTSGEFDWVLSAIDQDESYAG